MIGENRPMRVAMVCLGNICRSPMAASVARQLVAQAGAGGQITVESFGTAAYHEGGPADQRADAALERRGWPSGNHLARQLRAEDLSSLDLILCADRDNLANVRRLVRSAPAGTPRPRVELLRQYDPHAAVDDDEVADPYSGGAGEFEATLAIIERSCRSLLASLVTDSAPGTER
ncbi:MAG: protein tyrosine phosphatase [Acidimicrobiaceae bacterium]|nr:protein tyrosine phosphatase [Acidimicrobiaceae bacterium]